MNCVKIFNRNSLQIIQKRSLFKYETYSKKLWLKMQTPIRITPKSILKAISKKRMKEMKQKQSFSAERMVALGPDLAAAHFVVNIGGAVKFSGSDIWFSREKGSRYQLPGAKVPELKLEAANCSGTQMIYESFDHFHHLEHLQYLNLSGCEYIDDWCMDRLAVLGGSLLHLDVSRCPQVSDKGLSSLHRLRNLRRLELFDMSSVYQPEILVMMLEEVLPNCVITGIDYANIDLEKVEELPPTPKFITDYLEHADTPQEVDR